MLKDMSVIVGEISAEIIRKFPADSKDAHCWVKRVEKCGHTLGYTICDLKPLAELLGCEPVIEHISEHIANRQTWVSQRVVGQLVAQALNWERTEFNTLDELLEELRCATVCDLRPLAAGLNCEADIKAISEAVKVLLLPEIYGPRHTLLHAGELYREVTILLHTEQLVAWRTADGQEYSAPAHQVLLDPDEDGLAAAILSRIAGVEIAPEHMAELRAQMAGGAK